MHLHPAARTGTWVLAVASAAGFMATLDTLVVATALTTIRRDLAASVDALEWTVNAYNLSFAVMLLTAAALGDRFGRRRLFAAGPRAVRRRLRGLRAVDLGRLAHRGARRAGRRRGVRHDAGLRARRRGVRPRAAARRSGSSSR